MTGSRVAINCQLNFKISNYYGTIECARTLPAFHSQEYNLKIFLYLQVKPARSAIKGHLDATASMLASRRLLCYCLQCPCTSEDLATQQCMHAAIFLAKD